MELDKALEEARGGTLLVLQAPPRPIEDLAIEDRAKSSLKTLKDYRSIAEYAEIVSAE